MSLTTLLEAGLLDREPKYEEIEDAGLSDEDYELLAQWWAAPVSPLPVKHAGAVYLREFEEDKHPRDESGRFSSGGGGEASGGTSGKVTGPPVASGVPTPQTKAAVKKIAQDLGVKVTIGTASMPGTIGEYDQNTDTITLDDFYIGAVTGDEWAATIRHEHSHQLFEHARTKGDQVDNFVKDNLDALQREDGNTTYAKSFWDEAPFRTTDVPGNPYNDFVHRTCVNESLAEMRGYGGMTPTYMKLRDLVDELAK